MLVLIIVLVVTLSTFKHIACGCIEVGTNCGYRLHIIHKTRVFFSWQCGYIDR